MNQSKEYEIIKPVYYDKFACIMSACEDNCCNTGWKIYIDRLTYSKYKNISNPDFAGKLDRYVSLVTDDFADDFFFAQLSTAKEGYCPFQTKEGLCEIHRDYGEGFLSETCKSYPRNRRKMINEYLELSVSMSCPEAVRIALFDRSPMEFVIQAVQVEAGAPIPACGLSPARGEKETHYLKYGWQMRDAAITIMQDRSCPVALRIIIIAMMLCDAVNAHDEGTPGKIPEVLDYYCNAGYGSDFISGFDDAEKNEAVRIKMTTLLYFTIRGESEHPHSSKFAKLIGRFDRYSEGIYTDGAERAINAAEFYIFTGEAIDAHWDSFCAQYGHVLENYLVNYIFAELFPVKYHSNGLDPYHHIFLLAEQYAILRMLLCVNFDPDEGFSEQYIVQTISQVAVISQHSEKPLKLAEGYKKSGINSPAHLYYLLV